MLLKFGLREYYFEGLLDNCFAYCLPTFLTKSETFTEPDFYYFTGIIVGESGENLPDFLSSGLGLLAQPISPRVIVHYGRNAWFATDVELDFVTNSLPLFTMLLFLEN